MRRRLDLAAALVANPPLLFLDEPTTGLDPQSRQDLWAIIEGLVEGGTSVLLTTQYLEEADRLCKQLVVLDHGKIIAEGTSQELKTSLGNTVLVAHLHQHADARRGAALLDGISTKPANVDGTVVEFTVDNGPSSAADALRRIDGAAITLAGLHPSRAEPRRRLLEPHRPQGRGRRSPPTTRPRVVAKRKVRCMSVDHVLAPCQCRPRRVRCDGR